MGEVKWTRGRTLLGFLQRGIDELGEVSSPQIILGWENAGKNTWRTGTKVEQQGSKKRRIGVQTHFRDLKRKKGAMGGKV